MKKKLFGITIVAAIALMAGWNFSKKNDVSKLYDLALSNVEALASGEYGDKIWEIYYTSTGHSCIRGGSEACTKN